jgi:dipeptidyl aminopeptidase/acylaminoacyl peptidase
VIELYRVEVAAPGVATKLNAPLTAEGDAWFFRFRSDGAHLTYIADQDTDEVYELYDVDLANPGVATKLSAAPTGIGLYDFKYSPDNTQVFYASAEDSDFVEIYRIDVANPGISTRLNGNLAAGGEVWEFDIVQ